MSPITSGGRVFISSLLSLFYCFNYFITLTYLPFYLDCMFAIIITTYIHFHSVLKKKLEMGASKFAMLCDCMRGAGGRLVDESRYKSNKERDKWLLLGGQRRRVILLAAHVLC